MDPNIRASIQINTFYYFLIAVSFAIVTQLVTVLTIIFGGDISGKEHAVAVPLIVITLISSFGMVRMMLNLRLILSDMDEKMSNTNFGRETKAIPVHILGVLFSGLFLISAIVLLVTIYS